MLETCCSRSCIWRPLANAFVPVFAQHVVIAELLDIVIAVSRCAFSTNESCLEWCKRLMRAARPPNRLQQVFAFSFHAWLSDARRQQLTNGLSQLTKPGMMVWCSSS